MKYLILSLLITSCSHQPQKTPHVDAFLKLNDAHTVKHAACTQQNKEVYGPAITERTNPENGDIEFLFVRDEKAALSVLSKADPKKLTMRENELEYDALVEDCETNSVERPVCDTIWPGMKFHKGLLHAVTHYKWKAKTQESALRQIRLYLTHIGESQATLTNLQIGVDLLRQMSLTGLARKTLKEETDVLQKEMDSVHFGMKTERKKAAGKSIDCKQSQDLHKIERQAIERFSQKLLGLLET